MGETFEAFTKESVKRLQEQSTGFIRTVFVSKYNNFLNPLQHQPQIAVRNQIIINMTWCEQVRCGVEEAGDKGISH